MKNILLKIYGLVAYVVMFFAKLFCHHRDEVHLSLGRALSRKVLVAGGRVKLADLYQVYGDHSFKHNLIYAVSSAISKETKLMLEASLKTGAKLVWNQNGVAYPAWAGSDFERLNKQMKIFLHQADYVVYQSNFCKLAADKFLGEFKGNQKVIYNSVDTDIFKPSETKTQTNTLTLLVAGTSYAKQKIELPLKALASLVNEGMNIRLIIAGRLAWVNANQEVDELIKELNLIDRVDFLGTYLQTESVSIYQRSDILLHLKYADACPTTIVEAMACGLPVVSLDSGGIPELVGQAGELISTPFSWDNIYYPSAEDVAIAIKKVVADYKNLSSLSRLRAEEMFSKVKWLSEHREIFNKVIKK